MSDQDDEIQEPQPVREPTRRERWSILGVALLAILGIVLMCVVFLVIVYMRSNSS